MSGIFISYRREDTSYIAGRLHDRLSAHFGSEQIFRDIDTIRPGVDFVERIEQAVGSCDALVAVIGDQWLSAKDGTAPRRLDNPKDFVRLELAAALKRNTLLVPVLVENARMPTEAELPAPLRKLARRNALDLSDARWDYDVQKLIGALEEVVKAKTPAPTPPPAGPARPDAAPTPASPGPSVPRSSAPVAPITFRSQPGGVPRTPPRPHPPAPQPSGASTWVKALIPLGLLVVAVPLVLLAVRAGGGSGTEPQGTTIPPSTQMTSTSLGNSGETGGSRVISGPFSGRSNGLNLTVEKIEANSSVLRFHLLVNNSTGDTLTLPASRFTAVDNTGRSYRPDPFSNEWPREIPPGMVRGVLEAAGPLQAGAATMRVGWGTVFGTLKVDSIFVTGIELA